MEESIKKIRKRKKNIRLATDVNRRHADMIRTESNARKRRSHIQVVSELVDNQNIDYKKHMPFLFIHK
ncbi:hypothetical protein ACUIJP_04530 [Leuconostoc pseudomesenteroides]|uniref:hypothetical protein n=1 Tax=Leuconostoc pseudomesenteroides TaxID=33968 RepID=UPI00403DCF43